MVISVLMLLISAGLQITFSVILMTKEPQVIGTCGICVVQNAW